MEGFSPSLLLSFLTVKVYDVKPVTRCFKETADVKEEKYWCNPSFFVRFSIVFYWTNESEFKKHFLGLHINEHLNGSNVFAALSYFCYMTKSQKLVEQTVY